MLWSEGKFDPRSTITEDDWNNLPVDRQKAVLATIRKEVSNQLNNALNLENVAADNFNDFVWSARASTITAVLSGLGAALFSGIDLGYEETWAAVLAITLAAVSAAFSALSFARSFRQRAEQSKIANDYFASVRKEATIFLDIWVEPLGVTYKAYENSIHIFLRTVACLRYGKAMERGVSSPV